MVVYTADDLRNRIDELEAQLSELRENEKLLLKQRGELTKARDENAAHVRELQAMLRDQEGRLKSVSALAREHLADVNRMSVEVQSVREDLRTYQEAYADLWRDKHGGGPAPSPVTERDQLRAEVERLKAEAARPAYAFAAPDSVKLWAIYNESRVKRVYDCAKCALASQLSGEGFASILPEERSSWEESELPIRLCQCWRAALQGRAPDIPPADPERYAAAGSIPRQSGMNEPETSPTRWGLWDDMGRLLRTYDTREEAEAVQRSGQGVGVVGAASCAKGQFDPPATDSAGEDTPSVWEQSPARPGVWCCIETLSQLPDVQSRLAWLLRGLPKQTKTMEIGVPPALIQEAYDALERLKAELKCWTQGRADLQPVDSDYNNALIGIRWALQDLGLRVKSDPEATKSAVEVLCVQLRKEGRAWTGEMLGGLTCPSQMQKEDNAALKQRVFTALGTELLYRLERHHDLKPDLVAQFDLLGRDL